MVSLATTLKIMKAVPIHLLALQLGIPTSSATYTPTVPHQLLRCMLSILDYVSTFFLSFYLSIVYYYLPFLSLKPVFAPATLVPVLLVMMLATHTCKEIRQENFFLLTYSHPHFASSYSSFTFSCSLASRPAVQRADQQCNVFPLPIHIN